MTHATVAPEARRARAAVSALFFLNAVLYANLIPRLPEVKDALGLSNVGLGTGIAAMPLGALLAGFLAPVLITRFGSARVASFGLVLLAVAVVGVPLSGTWVAFAGVMLVVGAADSVVDVAQNAHGFRVQRLYGRSIVNAFHGLWSVGAVTGGVLGSVAAGLGVPLMVHLATSAAVFGAAALVVARFLLPGPEDAERGSTHASGAPHRAGWSSVGGAVPMLALLGLLAACGAFVEDAGATWGALFVRTEVGAGAAAGGLAFVSLQVAMTAGRLSGDRFVDRYGQRRVARVGGLFVALGIGLAIAVPSLPTAVAGFGLAGLGTATLIPAVMHTADELPDLPPGLGLTVVSTLLRVGFLVSPPLVGLAADLVGLRVAFLGVVATGLVVLVVGRILVGTVASRAGHHDVLVDQGSAGAPPLAVPERDA